MKPKTDKFKINDQSMLAPDAEVGFSYEDLDTDDSGRDEGGYMHRVVARYKVGKWSFSYSNITEAERAHLESLFPDKPTFTFTHPDRLDATKLVESTCYRSKYSISWFNAKLGVWKNYGFSIIEC